ncbi:amidohydrolase [Phytoactinopolyspora halotolerans]|uniref:Amidohydrolase n=1 Tax=Phytoactinopolyspora halotolerans TaxID=1981512 RepID=A0A6L9SDM9_9ACTN|nr:amidohydrolase [Phytoactinopolyspora halotolerans]NEE03485.1 amidohydrolase [Phytoactinopolyspora halotolerans]
MTQQQTVIYPARLVRTMDPARPVAEAVAVVGDRFRAVGTVEELQSYGPARIDRRYTDHVLMPGFVEAHSHVAAGAMWRGTYVGHYPRRMPNGEWSAACRTLDDVLAELARADAALGDPAEPLFAWGLDPIHLPGERLSAAALDRVSATRPIMVMHANLHILTLNSAAMALDRIDTTASASATAPPGGGDGVVTDGSGRLTGELREPEAMGLSSLFHRWEKDVLTMDADALRAFGAMARDVGATTLTDLNSAEPASDAAVRRWRSVVDADDYPARISQFLAGGGVPSYADAAARVAELRAHNGPKMRYGGIKLMLDGSIQGFTARLQPPGYLGSDENGLWVQRPELYAEAFRTYHRAGLLIHVHCNGDEATQVFLDTLEDVLCTSPRPGHRHTVTHSQLSTPAQYRRMAELGACANIFSNHLWYWGDQHVGITLGADRASRMNAAATALRCGVPISLHCDAPVTPLNPLLTAMYAIARRTESGATIGAPERITLDEAMRAITVGGAYLLKMDHEIGTVEAGKYADLAVLDTDPYQCVDEPEGLADIRVLGTMVGGVNFAGGMHFPAAQLRERSGGVWR